MYYTNGSQYRENEQKLVQSERKSRAMGGKEDQDFRSVSLNSDK